MTVTTTKISTLTSYAAAINTDYFPIDDVTTGITKKITKLAFLAEMQTDVNTRLVKSNNLSDLTNASTARTNLGLGTLATQSGTFSGSSSGTNTGDQTITLSGAVSGSGTGSFVTTLGSLTSAALLAALTDETGAGLAVFNDSPTILTPLIQNTSNSASVQAAIIRGSRASPANNDEVYLSINLNSSTSVTRETGRITSKLTTATNGAEIANMKFSIISAGSLIGVMQIQAGGVVPSTDDGAALGTTSNQWSDLFMASGAVVNIASSNWVMTHTSGIMTIGTGTLKITNPTNTSGSVLTTDGTQTETNKRRTPRVFTTASTATLTPEIDTYDVFHVTALAANITIANKSTSTPTDGELMRIRLLDNGTARTITFGTDYVAKAGTALPTTTVLSKNMVLLFEWNSNLSKWNLLSNGQEA